jgi:hypothetical protein
LREIAIRLMAVGMPFGEICRSLGLPRGTVGHWLRGERALHHLQHPPGPSRCPRCQRVPRFPDDQGSYSYLLGLYLGDGHLVTTAKIPVLRVYCADAWPGLIEQCTAAMRAVLANSVRRVQQKGCVGVQSYSNHWPCLLPQHGPGRKHDRPIHLTDWQQPIIDANAGHFLRGLFHSDGCRVTNQIRRERRSITIRDICSLMSHSTSWASAGTRSIGLASSGGCAGPICCLWRVAARSPDWTSTWDPGHGRRTWVCPCWSSSRCIRAAGSADADACLPLFSRKGRFAA